MNSDSLSRAAAAYRNRDYHEVVDLLFPLLDNQELPPSLLCQLGYALFQTGQYERSAGCWELLLRRAPGAAVEASLEMNLARASYMAAEAAAQSGRFDRAAHLMRAYRVFYSGDPRAKSLLTRLERLADLQAGIAAVEAAQRSAATGGWSEAADQLLAVRDRVMRAADATKATGA